MNCHHTLSLNEWIQTQLSLYFALSILSPQEAGLDRWLLCLAHKFFPTSVPDLIIRLNQNDLNIGKQLLLQHCQSLDAIRELHPTPNLAVIGSMPSFVCMQLDFIHMKLFTATVLHDINDLSHRIDQNHIWLDRVKTWSKQGRAILHSIENQTNVDTDHVASLEQLSCELSETVSRHLRAPLISLHQHRYKQHRKESMRRLQSLQQEFQSAYDQVIASIRRREDLTHVSMAVETATEAYQRWSGAAPAASTGLYSAMQKQYCEFRTRVQQVETQKSYVDAFVRYTDTLLQEARQLDTVDKLTLEAFKDRVHIATERMAARIPYPAHETLKNAKILDLVRHRKRALWEMQEALESKLLKGRQPLDEQLSVWIDTRTVALQDSIKVAAMPGLTLHDVQLLQKDCRAFRATNRRSDILDRLLAQLEHDLDQRERQAKLDLSLQQLSATIDARTQAIWDMIMPIEEGNFTKKSLSLDDTTYRCELEALTSHPQYSWIQQKHQDFVQLIEYAKELLAQRDLCASCQTQANDLQTKGKQYRHALERAWENIGTTMTSWDTYAEEADVFLSNARQLRLECPKNVKANRPKPCINMFASWLSDQCVTLLELSSSVSLLVQRYRLALEFKSEIDAYFNDVAAADSDLEYWTGRAQDINTRIANSCCSVMTFDATKALASLSQRIEQCRQAEEQRALDSAAAKARASWAATVAAFDAAADNRVSQELVAFEPTLQTLFESSQAAFRQLLDSTFDDEQEQRRLADTLESVRTALRDQNVMTGYAERHAAWQSHMDVALRLCDQHETTIRQFIQDVRSFVVTQPLNQIHIEVPDISQLESYVQQHSIHGSEKSLTAQWTLEERVRGLSDQLNFANTVHAQCGRIQDIIQRLEKNDTDGVAKCIQDPELYPARTQEDQEYNAMIRKRLQLLLDEALERRRAHEQSCEQRKLEEQCQAIVDSFKAQADAFEYTQMDALLLAGQDSIRRLNRLGARAEYAETIESALASIHQDWEQQLIVSNEAEKHRQDQQAVDAYQQVHDWVTQQHNAIQIFNDSNIQDHRALLQDLERKGVDVLLVQLHAERRRQNEHLHAMEAMYQRVKADHDDLLAAIDYMDELNSKKRQMESTQARVDGLLSAMRVMVTWALKAQDQWGIVKGEAIQAHCEALDATEAKASKAIDVFRVQTRGDEDLEQQYRETHAVLHETLNVVQAARPWCNVHLLFDSIESMVESKSAAALRAVLDDAEQQIMAYSDSANKAHAMERHGQLKEMVDAVEVAEEDARRRAAEMETRKAAERRRLSIEQAVQAAYKDCQATATAIANSDDSLHDFYLSSISTISVHQARRIKWMDPRLNEAVCTLESVYTCLESVCRDARQADEIQSWIKTWKGQDMSTMASTIEAYLASDSEQVPVPEIIKDAVREAAQRRRASVKAAWTVLREQVKRDEALAAEQMKEQQEREQLATVERLIARAHTQLRQCRWNLDKRDLASMPREPEALAVERRVTDLAATTASLLREHYPQTVSKNVDRTTVDMAIRDFFDNVQDTQCQIAQALAISEYLMISDDIHMMLSIFEESLPTHPCTSKQDLQGIEAQQKYYDEQIGQKLDTAQVIAHDNPILHKPYKQLCERWASVQRQVQILLRRQQRMTRGRLTSLPTLTASASGPSPLASASSPLSPRPSKKKRNNYEPDPENQLDVEIGRIVNQVPYSVKVEMVPGEVGRYWFGSRLVYCRILKSRMVMVRVGGGWTELSQFLRDHALLHDNSEIQVVNDEQGFIQMRSTRRPSLPPPLYNSSSSSTISSSSTTSSGYYMDGDRYMAVDQHGNYHTLKMTKVDHLLSSSGSRSILIK